MRSERKAQVTIEYALLIIIVSMVFAGMGKYAIRAMNANLNIMQEQLNASPQ